IPGPIDRPHAREKIGGLLRSVVEKFGNDLDRPQRPDDRDQRDEIEHRPQRALSRAEPLPSSRRHGRLACNDRVAHWNSRRIRPEITSPTITMAMIARTMVRTKS